MPTLMIWSLIQLNTLET